MNRFDNFLIHMKLRTMLAIGACLAVVITVALPSPLANHKLPSLIQAQEHLCGSRTNLVCGNQVADALAQLYEK